MNTPTRPWPITIAALVLIVAMLAGFGINQFFPQLGFSGRQGRAFANGAAAGTAGATNNGTANGSAGAAGQAGRTFGGNRFANNATGAAAGGLLGAATNANTTNSLAQIAVQSGLRIASIVFPVLGLIAAFGLFKIKRWGIVLTGLLFALALVGVFLPQATLLRLLLPAFGVAGRAGANTGLASVFTNFRLNWVNLIEPFGLLAGLALVLLPISRRAFSPQELQDSQEEPVLVEE